MIDDLEERILYEEDGFLVVNKPYGIPTSGRNLDDDDAVQYWLMQRQKGMVWAVHQLDADTSGVNIFVTEKKMVSRCQKALSDENSVKKYCAIVHGNPSWESCEERSSIGYIDSQNLGVTSEGKSAHSIFRVLERSGDFALIEATIMTGRTHQIRIHLHHLGHSLVGEEWYRSEKCLLHPRQALHASHISLSKPIKHIFEATLAPDLYNLARKLGLLQKKSDN